MGRLRSLLTLLSVDPGLFLRTVPGLVRCMRRTPKGPITTTISGVRFEFDFEFGHVVKLMC